MVRPDRIERLFLLDQPPSFASFHGPVWEEYRTRWKREYRSFIQRNQSPSTQFRDQLNHMAGIAIQAMNLAFLVAGALVVLLVLGSDSGHASFPIRDFWIAESIGLVLCFANYGIRMVNRRRRLLWMSVLDQRARVHMADWSQGYFMALAGVELTWAPDAAVVA